MNRRSFIGAAAGTIGAVLLPAPGLAAEPARRVFRILRGTSDIGRHTLDARLTPEGFEIAIGIDIAVRFLGITAYRYALENRELWRGGLLIRADSTANDDGEAHRARMRGGLAGIEVDGSGFSGLVAAEAVTTSYYVPEFLERRPWLSTQSGKPLEISARRAQSGRWRIAGELETTLVYDARGEWMGSEFDAGGEPARYELVEQSGEIAPLWQAA